MEDYKDRAKSSAPFYRKFGSDIPHWDDTDLTEKSILVWTEQGLGEEILFSGLLSELANVAGTCTLQCSSKLTAVFERSFSKISNLTVVDKECSDLNLRRFDVQTSLADLGRAFRPSLADFPDAKPYVLWDVARRADLRTELETRFGRARKFVGISWSSANPIIGDNKSIPLEMWRPILSIPGITFVNVQYGSAAENIKDLPPELSKNIVTLDAVDLNGGLDETLALLAALDELVTCSNTTAHLAGAAGLKTNVIVPQGRGKIWYWFQAGSTNPWYQKVKVHRQNARGQWDDAIKAIAESLDLSSVST